MEEQKKKYDLEERTEKFSLRIRDFCLKLKRDVINIEYIRQLVRAAGSIPANYIEANESLGNQDKISISKFVERNLRKAGFG